VPGIRDPDDELAETISIAYSGRWDLTKTVLARYRKNRRLKFPWIIFRGFQCGFSSALESTRMLAP
jgi:hypothetical protein